MKKMSIPDKMTRILGVFLAVQIIVMAVGFGFYLLHPLPSLPVILLGTVWNCNECRKCLDRDYDKKGNIISEEDGRTA